MIKIKVNNKFIKNVLSLSFLQGANLLLPLIVLPYLARTLGVDGYGLFVFAGVVVGYFGLICDYGFNLTGTRDVALVRNNPHLLNVLVSKIFLIKICLLVVCAASFLLISFVTPNIWDNFLLYVCSFGVILGQTFFPTWFFQGVEDFKSIVVLNFISKLIFTILIFLVVSEPSDVYLAALMNALGGFCSTLLAVRIVFSKHKVRLVRVNLNDVVLYAKKSIFVFVAQLKISLFSTANIFILGVFCGPKSVGYFSAAEKIMRALAQLQVPILTVLYPKLSVDLIKKRNQSIALISKLTKYGALFYCVVAFFVVAFADHIINLLFGTDYVESVPVLRIVAFCPLLIFLNNIYGTQVLLNFGKDRLYLTVLVIAGIFNVGASTLLTIEYGSAGTAFSLLFSELIVVFGMFYFAKNYLSIFVDEKTTLNNKE